MFVWVFILLNILIEKNAENEHKDLYNKISLRDSPVTNRLFYGLCKVLRCDLIHTIRKKLPELSEQIKYVIFHQDNAPAHTAAMTQIDIGLLGFDQVTHPPYGPDLAPMDFAVFPQAKAEVRNIRFKSFEELKHAILNSVKKLKIDWSKNVYYKWIKHHMKCIRHGD